MKAVTLADFGLEALTLTERPQPEPGPGEVLVRVRAASLNYRDLLVAQGLYGGKPRFPLVPLSDAAGEVAALGPGVSRFQPGQRVTANFFQGWLSGEPSAEKFGTSLGARNDGVLAEYRCFPEDGLVATPGHLDDAGAASLPCAGLTAWSAVIGQGAVKPGEVVLVQGTGGVSLFALQFAKMAGAEVIATSSSDEKLARAAALGADYGINYRSTPEWGKAARALLGGRGVDHIVEVGGAGTLNQSIRTVREGGTISMIGVLSGPAHEFTIPLVVMRNIRLQGVTVGSREAMEAMLRAVALRRMQPVVDRVFPLAEARAAYEHLAAGRHFGKVVIAL